MRAKPVTIKDVARECNVSPMTVSWVMNKPERVHYATRERVLETIKRLNYAPSAIARGLARQRMDTLGVVRIEPRDVKIIENPYFGHVLEGILTRSREKHQKILLYIEDNWENASDAIARFSDRQADGLVLIIPVGADNLFTFLNLRGVPFVIIGDNRPEPELSTADVDNVEAARMATQYLIDAGHRKIAHIQGPLNFVSAVQRLNGYRSALEAAGLAFDPDLVFEGAYLIHAGYIAADEILNLPNHARPTAIFCADDPTAFGVLDSLRDRGLSAPDDMSLIGINGGIPAIEKGLTTMRQPFEEIGSCSVDILLELIDTGTLSGKKVNIPATLVTGRTVGPPKPF